MQFVYSTAPIGRLLPAVTTVQDVEGDQAQCDEQNGHDNKRPDLQDELSSGVDGPAR